MDLNERMAELDARIAARRAELDRRFGGGAAAPAPASAAPASAAPESRAPLPEPAADAPGAAEILRDPEPAVRPAPVAPAETPRAESAAERPAGGRSAGSWLKRLFREVFRRHSDEEMEDYFSGGHGAAPAPLPPDGSWPVPWVSCRIVLFWLVVLALAFSAIGFGVGGFAFLFPAVATILFLAPSFATLVFFFEFDVCRNVSLFRLLRVVLAVFAVALLVFPVAAFGLSACLSVLPVWAACAAMGAIEEMFLLVALSFLIRGFRSERTLDGLLLGAAAGVGAVVFKFVIFCYVGLFIVPSLLSVGGPYRAFGTISNALVGVFVPYLLSLLLLGTTFMQVVWSAIVGAALMRAKRGASRPGAFLRGRSLPLFAIPVLSHALWYGILFSKSDWIVVACPVLFVATWAVAYFLVRDGLAETRKARGPADSFLGFASFVLTTLCAGFLLAAGGYLFTRFVAERLGA